MNIASKIIGIIALATFISIGLAAPNTHEMNLQYVEPLTANAPLDASILLQCSSLLDPDSGHFALDKSPPPTI